MRRRFIYDKETDALVEVFDDKPRAGFHGPRCPDCGGPTVMVGVIGPVPYFSCNEENQTRH